MARKKGWPPGLSEELGRYRIQFLSQHTKAGVKYRERLPEGTTLAQAKEHLHHLRDLDRKGELKWVNERRQETALQKYWTVGEFAEIYMQHCETENNSPKTLERKARALRELARWFWDIRLEEITKVMVTRFASERRAEGLSPRSVNIEIGQLAHLLNVAHELDYLATRPPKFRRIAEKGTKKPTRWLSHEEADIGLAAATSKGPVFRALFLFLLHTGARWSETRDLLWEDVDLNAGLVTFRGENTKDGEERMIPLLPEVIEELAGLERFGKYVFMRRYKDRVIRMTRDGRLHEGYPWTDREKGFNCSPHVLRHTFATWQLREGVGMEKVQKLLGHSTINLTVDTYGHIVAQDHVDEVAKMYRPARKVHLRIVGEKE
ncbi:MAG: site-specific integrase [Myxococcales bacterium]|nr:site-specific integrase [Myxococcales bacterium]